MKDCREERMLTYSPFQTLLILIHRTPLNGIILTSQLLAGANLGREYQVGLDNEEGGG